MAEEIALKNSQMSNFKGLMTLTLDQVIQHTVVHLSSTSTYMQIALKSKKFFRGRTDVRMDRHMDRHLRPALLDRLCRRVDLKLTKISYRLQELKL